MGWHYLLVLDNDALAVLWVRKCRTEVVTARPTEVIIFMLAFALSTLDASVNEFVFGGEPETFVTGLL